MEYNLAILLPKLDKKPVKSPAFSIARYKIKIDFFLELNKIVYEHIETLKPKLWKNYRLVAGVGTTLGHPASKDIKNHFGIYETSKGGTNTCIANVCLLYDAESSLVLDTNIGLFTTGEVTMMGKLIDRCTLSNALILLDRGFGNVAMFKRLYSKKLDFCVRIKTSQSLFAAKVLSNPLNDFITEWKPSESEKETCKKYGFDTSAIKVRVTKVVLNSGEIEVLISSLLDQIAVCESDMKELYHKSWIIEEGIKKLKPKMKLEQFGCRRHEGIYQEFYSHVLMMNISTLIANQSEEYITLKTTKRKHKYKYNWQNSFLFFKNEFVNLFYKGAFEETLQLVLSQIKESVIAIIPNRNFERHRDKRKHRFSPCYK